MATGHVDPDAHGVAEGIRKGAARVAGGIKKGAKRVLSPPNIDVEEQPQSAPSSDPWADPGDQQQQNEPPRVFGNKTGRRQGRREPQSAEEVGNRRLQGEIRKSRRQDPGYHEDILPSYKPQLQGQGWRHAPSTVKSNQMNEARERFVEYHAQADSDLRKSRHSSTPDRKSLADYGLPEDPKEALKLLHKHGVEVPRRFERNRPDLERRDAQGNLLKPRGGKGAAWAPPAMYPKSLTEGRVQGQKAEPNAFLLKQLMGGERSTVNPEPRERGAGKMRQGTAKKGRTI